MKVIVMVKATKASEAGEMPTQQLLTDMGNYNGELVKAGIMQAAEGLHPSSKGVRVRFSGANRTVTDGPFTETNELVAGFWLWDVKSMREAIDWVKRCPNPMMEDSEIEIRPIFSTPPSEPPAGADPSIPPATRAEPAGALEGIRGSVLGKNVKTVFVCWIVLFALVGAQMSWVLRPFIGNPNQPFEWFRSRESNFFEAVGRALGHLFW